MPLAIETTYAVIGLVVATGLLLASGPGMVAFQIIKFCAKAMVYMIQAGLVAFFFGTERDVRRYRDPLMEMIAESPLNSMAFMRRVMYIATFASATSAMPSAVYLMRNWRACASCDKPLRWWLMINCGMALAQMPLRVVFSLRLRHLASQRIEVMTGGLNYLTSSRAWCVSKILSLVNYAWFALGVFWTFTNRGCPESPFMIHAAVGVILASLVRVFLTLGSFYYYFPGPPPGRTWRGIDQGAGGFFGATLRPLPLERQKIDTLPVSKYSGKLASPTKDDSPASNSPEICPICLTEFECSDLVRRLPMCYHLFHLGCIDKWLQNCGTCPLCQRPLG